MDSLAGCSAIILSIIGQGDLHASSHPHLKTSTMDQSKMKDTLANPMWVWLCGCGYVGVAMWVWLCGCGYVGVVCPH